MRKFWPLCLAIFAVTPALGAFPDTGGHPNEEAINYVQTERIVQGYPDGTYRPNQTINRAEFTKIIVGGARETAPPARTDCFSDVSAVAWYASYVCHAKEKAIIDGYSDGSFRPAATINVAEAAKIVVNTFQVPTPSTIGQTEWYEKYLSALRIKNALPFPEPSPSSLLTRGQMAEIVYRVKVNASSSSSQSSRSSSARCIVGGCSGQLCGEGDDPGFSTCEWRPEYACYRSARCERQNNGRCGWTMTDALEECLDDPPDDDTGAYLDYSEGIVGNGRESVLFFWDSSCSSCRDNEERLREWADDELLARHVYKVEFDRESDLKREFDVDAEDTFILIDEDGDEIERVTFPSQERLADFVQ